MLLRQVRQPERVWLRFVDGRPVSAITEQFLALVLRALQETGVRVWLLIWDNASWHVSKRVRAWIRVHNRHVKQHGQGVRILLVLSAGQEPLAQPDRAEVGPWQARHRRARPPAQRPGDR